MSTWTLPSFSYLWTPAAAIFQKSLALLVTNASLTTLPDDAPPPPLLSHPVFVMTARPSRAANAEPTFHAFAIFTAGLLVWMDPRAAIRPHPSAAPTERRSYRPTPALSRRRPVHIVEKLTSPPRSRHTVASAFSGRRAA